MEKYKGKIKFYDYQVDTFFPENYNKFCEMLGDILGLSDDFTKNIRLSYRDEDNDKIEIKVENDYKLFFDEIKKRKIATELLVEIKEESNILIKQCTSSIMKYVSENSSLNINNVSEDIKEKHKSLELSDEINPNNVSNENEKKDEDVLNIENKKDNNIIINNPSNNIQNEIHDDQKAYKVILDNNINQNQNQNFNNINNNIQNNNNVNNIKNNVNNNIVNPQQQRIHNQQQQNVNLQKNQVQRNNALLYILSFPFTCVICRRGPIYKAIYYCKECKIIICPQCELREGPNHLHPLWKAQNTIQFEALNTADISTFDKIMNDVGAGFEGAYKSVVGFFSGNKNQQNQNQNQNKDSKPERKPQWVSLVQIARTNYDLRTVTDQQIEQALIKTRGNVDEAVILLTSQ